MEEGHREKKPRKESVLTTNTNSEALDQTPVTNGTQGSRRKVLSAPERPRRDSIFPQGEAGLGGQGHVLVVREG